MVNQTDDPSGFTIAMYGGSRYGVGGMTAWRKSNLIYVKLRDKHAMLSVNGVGGYIYI